MDPSGGETHGLRPARERTLIAGLDKFEHGEPYLSTARGTRRDTLARSTTSAQAWPSRLRRVPSCYLHRLPRTGAVRTYAAACCVATHASNVFLTPG